MRESSVSQNSERFFFQTEFVFGEFGGYSRIFVVQHMELLLLQSDLGVCLNDLGKSLALRKHLELIFSGRRQSVGAVVNRRQE